MAHTRRAFSARTDRHDCFSKTTAFTRVVSNDALMKLGGGGDKVCASVCVCMCCLESHVFISPTLIALERAKYAFSSLSRAHTDTHRKPYHSPSIVEKHALYPWSDVKP